MLSIEEINELERKNEINVRQYNELLKQYNTVLKIAKENADAMDYCCNELEKKFEKIRIKCKEDTNNKYIKIFQNEILNILEDSCVQK